MPNIATSTHWNFFDVLLRYVTIFLLTLAVIVLCVTYFWLQEIALLIYEAPANAWYMPELSGRKELEVGFYREKLLRYIAKFIGLLITLSVVVVLIRLGRQTIGLAAVCSSVVIVVIATEVFLSMLIAQPQLSRMLGMASIGKSILTLPAIQYEPDCARYDVELAYTLQPGSCTFDSSESVDVYEINSAGLRDSEDALIAPEIILLGDSFAMGWGLAEEETISAHLSEQLGRKVLNAGVSSYGTARQLRLLDRLDTSGLETLIILYVSHGQEGSDYYENKEFVEHGYQLEIMSKQRYQQIQSEYLASQEAYTPGSLLLMALFSSGEGWFLPRGFAMDVGMHLKGEVRDPEVSAFLEVLEHASTTELEGVRILVLEPSGVNSFPTRLSEHLASEQPSTPYANQIEVIKTLGKIDEEDYFVHDPHFSPKGSKKIADLLAEHLKH